MKTIVANLEGVYISRPSAHLELELTDKKYEEFQKLSEEEQREMIINNGYDVLDDYLFEFDEITKITVY